jgi:23S rRNA (uridine2552-2'-O)-methyltransferase
MCVKSRHASLAIRGRFGKTAVVPPAGWSGVARRGAISEKRIGDGTDRRDRMAYKRKDGFYRRAKEAGYRSRAAYKLIELSRRHRLIRPGDRVVDLGAWPGGWLQVAAELVGPGGRVVGVDLVSINPVANPVATCLMGDVRDPSVQEEIARLIGSKVDVVLSDMAPKLTGVRATDVVRSAELAQVACQIGTHLLRSNGRLLLKTFVSPDTDALVAALRGSFAAVRRARPEATRSGSAEFYIVALGFQPEQQGKRS